MFPWMLSIDVCGGSAIPYGASWATLVLRCLGLESSDGGSDGCTEAFGGGVKEVNVSPTSRVTAKADDIELRRTSTTRLVFRPLFVDNSNDPDACIRGEFVFQRKRPDGAWEDHSDLTLANLRADEWIKVQLRSGKSLTCIGGSAHPMDMVLPASQNEDSERPLVLTG